MKSIAFVAVLACLLGVFGAFVLPGAVSPDPPQAGPTNRSNIVLATASPNDESCPWKRRTETTVRLYSDA